MASGCTPHWPVAWELLFKKKKKSVYKSPVPASGNENIPVYFLICYCHGSAKKINNAHGNN